jgi:uncharacterized OB-fold protein
MPYLPNTVPGPKIDEVNAPFWENCRAHRLTFQQCSDCGHLVHPPLPVCPRCQSLNRGWKESPPSATVFSFTWVHTAAHESVANSLPYNVALVEFPDTPGVRLVTNVVDAKPGELSIGDKVRLKWEDGENGQALPRFCKRE